MSYIGFIVCVMIMLYVSAVVALVCVNCLGRFNIGGVPNTRLTKARAWLLIAGALCGWWLVFHFAPFTISFKG